MMMLGELIAWLESKPVNTILKPGICDPHSDRGSYADLAFDLCTECTVQEALTLAKSQLGATHFGYKGGEYRMDKYSYVVMSKYGKCGHGFSLLALLAMEAQLGLPDNWLFLRPLTP